MNELIMHHYHHRSGQIDTLTLEIGTPGKGGVVKVRGDADDPEQFMRRVKTAYAMKDYASEFQNGNLPAPSYVRAAQEQRAVGGQDLNVAATPKIATADPVPEGDLPDPSPGTPTKFDVKYPKITEAINLADAEAERQRQDLKDMEDYEAAGEDVKAERQRQDLRDMEVY